MLDQSRRLANISTDDPRGMLSMAARIRIDDAYFLLDSIRAKAFARIRARYDGERECDLGFDEYLRTGTAAEEWSDAMMEGAFAVLSIETEEFMAIGKRGKEIEDIVRQELEGCVNSLEMSQAEEAAVWSRLYTLRLRTQSTPSAPAVVLPDARVRRLPSENPEQLTPVERAERIILEMADDFLELEANFILEERVRSSPPDEFLNLLQKYYLDRFEIFARRGMWLARSPEHYRVDEDYSEVLNLAKARTMRDILLSTIPTGTAHSDVLTALYPDWRERMQRGIEPLLNAKSQQCLIDLRRELRVLQDRAMASVAKSTSTEAGPGVNGQDVRPNEPIQFYSCFISYSHDDKPFAKRLFDTLQGRGVRCWLDEKQMLPGDDIYEQVDRGIRMWDKVLLCCSEQSLCSWWVDYEIDSAFEKERKLMTERGQRVLALIPLDIDGHLLSGKWQSGKAQQVLSRLAADFTGWDRDNAKFEAQMDRVVAALRAGDGGRPPVPKPRLRPKT